VLALIDAIFGIVIGAIEGYFGGWVDLILQRLIEIWSSIPFLYALIFIASVFEPGIGLLVFILSLFGWIGNQSYVRMEFLKTRNREYVKAAKALGVGDFTIMARHILPNALTIVITRFPFSITSGMSVLVSMDFLGLGVPAPNPSFGESLKQGLENLNAWWIGIPTFFTLMLILVLVTFIGEAVLDVFDPKRR
jgi:microcin C transport system permease protein